MRKSGQNRLGFWPLVSKSCYFLLDLIKAIVATIIDIVEVASAIMLSVEMRCAGAE
jgi:hypothetical protein